MLQSCRGDRALSSLTYHSRTAKRYVTTQKGDRYERIDRSQLPGLDDLDFDLLRRCILMVETDAGETIRTFRRGM
ncbi:MAG: hypothetical protein LH647_11855 [Leptolyngbyaceae cyanobacterium CAN_BIN12]|nr:hypothetical protein [Leptolyngbyaceae cyanobacterium CAN_BIN12]